MTMVMKMSLTANLVTSIMMFPWQSGENFHVSIFEA